MRAIPWCSTASHVEQRCEASVCACAFMGDGMLPLTHPALNSQAATQFPPPCSLPAPPQRGTDRGFCTHNFLSPATMNMLSGMRSQLLSGVRCREGGGEGAGRGAVGEPSIATLL